MKENSNKDICRKECVCPQCPNCRKNFYFENLDKIEIHNKQKKGRRNIFFKNKQETDVNFRLISNPRNRIYESLKGLTKQSSSRDILGVDIETYRR